MQNYWDRSWASVAPERISAYVQSFDSKPDAIMQIFHSHGAKEICDAGCGCGIYTLRLAKDGFTVHGFDRAQDAVNLSRSIFRDNGFSADLKCASVLSTGYESSRFDGVICRDVLDHMTKRDAISAMQELIRITRPNGCLCITLDALDEEYRTEPHFVNTDGDYVFTEGKWNGMVFHPYTEEELCNMLPSDAKPCFHKEDRGGILLVLHKKQLQ